MNKGIFTVFGCMLLLGATVTAAQECSTDQGCIINQNSGFSHFWEVHDYNKFRCKFIEACKNYVAVLNMLPSQQAHPSLPVLTGDDGIITSLRKVALQFQDLRLRHDMLTGFTFNSISRPARNAENIALQKLFIKVQDELHKIADSEENIRIHGYEVCTSYSMQMMVLALRKDLEAVANYKGDFAPIVAEAIFAVIDPYLLEYTKICKPADKIPFFTRDAVINSRGFMEE